MQDIIHAGPPEERPPTTMPQVAEQSQQHFYTIIKHDQTASAEPRSAKQQSHQFIMDGKANSTGPHPLSPDSNTRRILLLQEQNFKNQFQQTIQPNLQLPAVLLSAARSAQDMSSTPQNYMTVSQPNISLINSSNKNIPQMVQPIYFENTSYPAPPPGVTNQYATLKQQQQKLEVRNSQVRTEINVNEISPLVSSRLEPRSLKRQRFSLLKLGNSPSQLTPSQAEAISITSNNTAYPIEISDSKRFIHKGKCRPDDPVEMRQEEAQLKVLDRLQEKGPRIHRAKPIRLQSIEFESPTHYRRQHQQLAVQIERARNVNNLPTMPNNQQQLSDKKDWIAVSPTKIGGITKYCEQQKQVITQESARPIQKTLSSTKQAQRRKLTPAQLHQLRAEKRRLGAKPKISYLKTEVNINMSQPISPCSPQDQISEESEYEDTVLYGVPKCDQNNSVVDLSKFVTKRDFCPKGSAFTNTTAKTNKKLSKNKQLSNHRKIPSCESFLEQVPSAASLQQRLHESRQTQQRQGNSMMQQQPSQRTLLANRATQVVPMDGIMLNRKHQRPPLEHMLLSIQTPVECQSRNDDETNSFDQSSVDKMKPIIPVYQSQKGSNIDNFDDMDAQNRKVVFQTTSSRPSGMPLQLGEERNSPDNRVSDLLPALKHSYGTSVRNSRTGTRRKNSSKCVQNY